MAGHVELKFHTSRFHGWPARAEKFSFQAGLQRLRLRRIIRLFARQFFAQHVDQLSRELVAARFPGNDHDSFGSHRWIRQGSNQRVGFA